MDPRQIFKNVTEGNSTISFKGIISVAKDEEIYNKETDLLIALCDTQGSLKYNVNTFTDVVNMLRRYNKEINSTTTDEQRITLSYEYIFKCITNENTIQTSEFRQKIKSVLDQSKDMKQPLKRFLKKTNDNGEMSLEIFVDMMNQSDDTSSTSSKQSSVVSGDIVTRALALFSEKDEGRNSLPIPDCVDILNDLGMNQDDISCFVNVADTEMLGELTTDRFGVIVGTLKKYYDELSDDQKNKEIIDEKYFGLFAQVLCGILSTEKDGVVKVSVLQKALNSLVGKNVNGRPVVAIDIETTEETVDAEEVAQLIKKSSEKSERNDNEEKIDDVPIHGGNIDSNNSHDAFNDSMSDDSDVNDYNPNWFTRLYLNVLFSCIDAVFD
ncbi:AIG1 family protein [Entamoeba marina]